MTTDEPPAAIRAVLAAEQAARAAQQALRVAAVAARTDGHTWAEIGAALGITRQAAFKRFGGPRDPRTGAVMTGPPVSTAELAALAEQVWRDVDAGDYPAVRQQLCDSVADTLDADAVLGTWATVVAETGNLERCHDTRVETGDGSPVADGDPVLGVLVVHTELVCEAGSWVGRVALRVDGDGARQVVGLLVLPLETPRSAYAF